MHRKVLAVIPARKGSKGFPLKNRQTIMGESLVKRAVNCALQLGAKVIVSTDDDYFRRDLVGILCDIHDRPIRLAGDTALAWDVWRDALFNNQSYDWHSFDAFLYLEPTSPLRTTGHLQLCLDALSDHESAFTCSYVPNKYSAPRQFTIEQGRVRFADPSLYNNPPRQAHATHFVRNGLCYAGRASHLQGDSILTKYSHPIVCHQAVNIDSMADLNEARRLCEEAVAT